MYVAMCAGHCAMQAYIKTQHPSSEPPGMSGGLGRVNRAAVLGGGLRAPLPLGGCCRRGCRWRWSPSGMLASHEGWGRHHWKPGDCGSCCHETAATRLFRVARLCGQPWRGGGGPGQGGNAYQICWSRRIIMGPSHVAKPLWVPGWPARSCAAACCGPDIHPIQ
jgi:hypothetical protein